MTAPEVDKVTIRLLRPADADMIAAAFAGQGWDKPAEQYRRYHAEQCEGKREVLVAEMGGAFAGYLTIVWQSDYRPFGEQGIPEIVDLNVLIFFRRQGVASALLAAEARIATRSPLAGIGVGVTADYGAAHILYVHRGFVPDGRGLASHGRSLSHGDIVIIDDNLTRYFTKKVGTSSTFLT